MSGSVKGTAGEACSSFYTVAREVKGSVGKACRFFYAVARKEKRKKVVLAQNPKDVHSQKIHLLFP